MFIYVFGKVDYVFLCKLVLKIFEEGNFHLLNTLCIKYHSEGGNTGI
jgi:hypothetical protein